MRNTHVALEQAFSFVEVRGSDVEGYGAFAQEFIARGTVVMPLTGKKLARHEFDTSDYSIHVLQIDTDTFLMAEGGPDDYINHSCDANLSFTEDGAALYALKDITPGEELFFDYSTSENDPHWHMNCRCGAASCRGQVTAFSRLENADKQLLIKRAMPYIRQQYSL